MGLIPAKQFKQADVLFYYFFFLYYFYFFTVDLDRSLKSLCLIRHHTAEGPQSQSF